MIRKKLVFQKVRLGFAIALALATFTSSPLYVRSQLAPSVSNSVVLQAQFPPGSGRPTGRRRGGTSRGDLCRFDITALVPGEEIVEQVNGNPILRSKSFLASTVSEHPTFWVYVPELPANMRSAEFSLVVWENDQDNHNVYQTTLTLPEKSGLIGIRLPSSPQYSLEAGKKYHWYFKVYCGEQKKTSEYFFVDGFVQRVALTPELESDLKAAKSREYIAYAANNIWHNALTNLADLRSTDARNATLIKDWANLLTAVGLEDLAQEPIVQRYSF